MKYLLNKKLNKSAKYFDSIGDMSLKNRTIWLLNNLNISHSDSFVDIGCGDGYFVHMVSLISPNTEISGFDLDQKALNIAKSNNKKYKEKIIYGNLMKKLPYKDNVFSKAIMSEVAEHLPNDRIGFQEIYRILKPGGMLGITVPNKNYPFLWDPVNKTLEKIFRTHIQNGFFAGIWNQHERLYSQTEILKVIKDAGFKIIKTDFTVHYCLPFNHYFLNLAARYLHSSMVNKNLAKQISKFEHNTNKPKYLKFFYYLVNSINKHNNYYQGTVSTNILLLAKKPL